MSLLATVHSVAAFLPSPLVSLGGGDGGLLFDVLGIVAPMLPFGIGVFFLFAGFSSWRTARKSKNTPTEKARSVAAGRTELSGTARATQGTVDQPFADGQCLGAAWQVEEWEWDHDDDDEDGKTKTDGSWRPKDQGQYGVPFELEDETGSISVASPAEGKCVPGPDNRMEIVSSRGEAPPPAVAEFLEDHDIAVYRRTSERYRYRQQVLLPDEDVYVLGNATPQTDAEGDNEDRLVVGPDGDHDFVLGNSEEQVTDTLTKSSLYTTLIGIFLSAIGLSLFYVLNAGVLG